MRLEVLVSTMKQSNFDLIKKMNIRSDAIIINQFNSMNYEEVVKEYGKIRMYTFNERGVGLSRNSALMRSDADIVLFADDDVVYVDDYKNIIIKEFENNPQVDIIIFNISSGNNCAIPQFKKNKKLHLHNILKFGTYRIAARRNSLLKNNITFSLLFGGGAKYSAGEDSFFLRDCIKSGLKCMGSVKDIGIVTHEESTWFKGYNEKYFFDKGVFARAMFKHRSIAYLFCLQDYYRHKNLYFIDTILCKKDILSIEKKGIKEF